MTIDELNTKVTIKHYTTTQDNSTGKTNSSLTASREKWAKVEQLNGSKVLDNAAVSYKEAFKITIRYEVSRPTLTNYHVNYKNKEMIIHSVVAQQEGKQWFEIITAFTTV